MTTIQLAVDRVIAMRKALPGDRFRFLIPDEAERFDRDYLSILVVLHDAANAGTGDMSRGDLVDLSSRVIEQLRGASLDEDTLEARLKSLEGWKLVEKEPETQVQIKLSEWSRGYQRYRITEDGAIILDMLLSVEKRKRKTISSQDAVNVLQNMEASLNALVEEQDADDAPSRERSERLRMSYLTLQGIVDRDHENLLQYLRELNKQVLSFGLRGSFNPEEFRHVVDKLEAYIVGIHTDFRARSKRIVTACEQLGAPPAMARLRLGYHLALEEDKRTLFAVTESARPTPEELLRKLTEFFDASRKQSLTAEVVRIRNNTTVIVGRLRDHWQRVLERTSFVQQLDRAWEKIKTTSWTDDAAWDAMLAWNAGIFELRPIPTAPNLGDEATPRNPPLPRKRYTRRANGDEVAAVTKRKSSPKDLERQEQEIALTLNALVTKRLLNGRDTALLSEFALESHDDFRDLIQIAKNTEVLLSTPIARDYFDFTASLVPDAQRVTWLRHDAKYEAPEIRFTARRNRRKGGEAVHA